MKPRLLPLVAESLARLRREYELIVIEGAGSPAEINLRDTEIVNMEVARLADAPVLLVGDIDRGGVLAAFVGTLALLDADDRHRVAGFVVNKFRGDPSLLAPGLDVVTARTGVPVLGVVPWIDESLVPAEDSLSLDELARARGGEPTLEIGVARLPRIANFDDFEPLTREPGVRIRLVRRPVDLDTADLIVVPGSKSTVADLAWLREGGLAAAITATAARGRPVLGVCGGYQMLGTAIHDPDHVESLTETTAGLNLLPVVTTFARRKTTVRISARVAAVPGLLEAAVGMEITAYEIHAGQTSVSGAASATPRPFTVVARQGSSVHDPDGAVNAAGNVLGTYLHGLFGNDGLRRAILTYLAERSGKRPDPRWGAPSLAQERYDRLADIVEAALDMPAIAKLVGLVYGKRAK